MAYVIAISNEKGGVAKTTTAISLGAALAESGSRVLLIDLDPQANLSLGLGIEKDAARITMANVLLDSRPLLEAIQETEIERLFLVPSASRLETAEQSLPFRGHFMTLLREALEALAEKRSFEYILLDCPPALGSLTLNALAAAHLLIIPTQPEFFSAYALRDMMSLIRRVRQEANPELAYRILVTMMDRRNRVHREIHEQLCKTFSQGVFNTVIEVDTRLRESPIAGLPITHYKGNSRSAQQYRALAQELMEYVQEKSLARGKSF